MSLFVVLLAAGEGKRLKSVIPKPFNKVNNMTLLEYSLNKFKSFPEIKKIVIVYNKKHTRFLKKINLQNTIKIVGGKTRAESVFKALKKIKGMNCKKVLIHDSARPYTPKKLIKKIIDKLNKNHAVIPLIKVNDATKRIKRNIIFKNIDRNSLRYAQTPQGFNLKKIYENHKSNLNKSIDDDSSLFVNNNEKILIIRGSKRNLKITDKEDLDNFKSLKEGKVYYGVGFDIHRLVKNKKLFLGGIKISYHLGLQAHSDGDPVLHALIDSILGACKLGDIGRLFSNKNKKYKNIRSTILLKKTISLIKSRNFIINNIDINIIAQKPKIKKYVNKMKNSISKLCEINTNQINIKGKTTEKLGLIGKEKAIASEIITSVVKND